MLSARNEEEQESVYSLAQRMRAYYTWSTLARIRSVPAVSDFFNANSARLRGFQEVVDSGRWTPSSGSYQLLASVVLAEIASRFGELVVESGAIYAIPGNRRLAIVLARSTGRRQAFSRAGAALDAEGTIWKPFDALSPLAPELPMQLIEPLHGLFVRNHDELLMSWWLGGTYWANLSDEHSARLVLPPQHDQPESVAAALSYRPRAGGGGTPPFKIVDDVDAVNALISGQRASITGVPLTVREHELIDKRAAFMLLTAPLPDDLEPWRISDAVWLELATMFALPSLDRKPGGAARKVLVGTAEGLEIATALLAKFAPMYKYSGPHYASFMLFSQLDRSVRCDELVYFVLTWYVEPRMMQLGYDKVAQDADSFQEQFPRPFKPRALALLQEWLLNVWHVSRAQIPGKQFAANVPLYYWATRRDDFKARPGEEVKILSAANPLRLEFEDALLDVFRPMVVPVPFTFLYYAAEPVALRLLEAGDAQRRTLRSLLETLAVRLQETGPVNRLQAAGETSVWTSLATLAALQATVVAETCGGNATLERVQQARQQFRELLLTQFSLPAIDSLDRDQSLPAPLYQRLFYVWFGPTPYQLKERASAGAIK